MRNKFLKPTVFFIIGIILIIVGLPLGLYGLTLSGGSSLGGAIILFAVFVVIIFLVFDRILVHLINNKKLNIIEFSFLLISGVIYLYQNRTIEIKQLNQNSEFMILIENNVKLINNKYNYDFPFNKKIITTKNYVIAKNLPQNIDLKTPNNWDNSYYYNIYKYPKYPKVILFGKISSNTDSLQVLNYIENNVK